MLFLIIEESIQYSLGNRENKETKLLGVYTKEHIALHQLNKLNESIDDYGCKTEISDPGTRYEYRMLEVEPNEEIEESLAYSCNQNWWGDKQWRVQYEIS